MNSTKTTLKNDNDPTKKQQDGELKDAVSSQPDEVAIPLGDNHCPDCSPGDLMCKCCGISVATEEWCEDDKMCSSCLDLEAKNKKDA